MRIFKISDYLGDDIERILKSRGMLYLRKADHTIKVDLSGHQYRRIVARAQCEKRNREENLPENVSYWIPKVESKRDMNFFYAEYTELIDYNDTYGREMYGEHVDTNN